MHLSIRVNSVFVILISVILAAAIGCNSVQAKDIEPLGFESKSYCAPPRPYLGLPSIESNKPNQPIFRPELAGKFSDPSLYIANITGLTDELVQLAIQAKKLEKNPSPLNLLLYIQTKENVVHKFTGLNFEIESVLSQLDCEAGRTDMALQYVVDRNETKKNNRTVWAIVGGGIADTFATMMKAGSTKNAFAIIGGALGIFLGGSVFFVNEKVPFYHSENLLTAIRSGKPESGLWPPAVWAYLNDEKFSYGLHPSIRTNLVENWKDAGILLDKASLTQGLYFGNGGEYTGKELANRSRMLKQLRSMIKLMQQDLHVLYEEMSQNYPTLPSEKIPAIQA